MSNYQVELQDEIKFRQRIAKQELHKMLDNLLMEQVQHSHFH